jgi:tripartite-type tricarboxylate transporter receptor subunit TctC
MTATRCCAFALAALAAAPVCAQKDFPNRSMRIVVGFLPGSSNDILARFIGQKLGERYGQQVIVDNRPGASGIIGNDIAARSSPDGHTLLLMTTSYTMSPPLYALPYDPHRAFIPVTMLGNGPLALVANPAIPPKNAKELIEFAKARPGAVSYASAGSGGVNHFGAELFARIAGIQMLHVPYKGGAPALTDVIAGQVNIMFATLPLSARQIQAGKVRAFGVSSLKRSPLLPDVPPLAEAGAPGYELNNWWGLAVPGGTPEPIVAKLNADVVAILAQPEAAQRLENEGAEPRPMTSAAFTRLVNDEIAKWTRVAREAGIKAQ